mgnify:CR=1 FL=1
MTDRTMISPAEIVSALRAEGLTVVVMPGYYDRCRCHNGSHARGERPSGRPFGPLLGMMQHHTAGPMVSGSRAYAYTQNILIAGNGATVGPLCLGGIGADGTIYLVSAGRANHAGGVSAAAKDITRREAWSLAGNHNQRGSGTDGNTFTIGWEIMAPHAPNAVQRAVAVRATAAICRAMGWTGQGTHGHGEASDQRDYSDPGFVGRDSMGQFRRDVMTAVRTGTVTVTPTATPLEEDDMPYTPEQLQKIVLDSYTTPRGHGLLKQAAAAAIQDALNAPLAPGNPDPIVSSSLRNNLVWQTVWAERALAALADDGVDEKSLATALAESLLPTVRDVVEAAVRAGGTPDAVADEVMDRLGKALTQS